MNINKILKNNDISELIKKGGISLLIRIIGFIAGYIFMYYTVKFFGAETQGRLSISFSFMIFGSLICRLGIDTNFVKIFAIKNNLENAKGIYFKMFPYVLFITFLVSILIYFFADYISVNFFNDAYLGTFLKWTAPCILFFTFILLNASVFRGLKKNTLYSFLFNGGRFLFTLIIFLLFYFLINENPISVVVAHSIGVFLLFVFSFIYIYKYLFPIKSKSTYEVKGFVLNSLPMLFSAAMTVFLGWTDTIILGIYEGVEKAGIYNVGLKIAIIVSFSLQALNSILAPKLSHTYHNNDFNTFNKLVNLTRLINFIISLTLIILIIIFRNTILSIFGEEFLLMSFALVILCIGQLFNAFCGPVGIILQMTGNQKTFQNILFIAILLNLSLNLSLVETYGINGVAFATAISLSFWNISAYIYSKRVINKLKLNSLNS